MYNLISRSGVSIDTEGVMSLLIDERDNVKNIILVKWPPLTNYEAEKIADHVVYFRKIRQRETWGGELELISLVHMSRRPLILFNADGMH